MKLKLSKILFFLLGLFLLMPKTQAQCSSNRLYAAGNDKFGTFGWGTPKVSQFDTIVNCDVDLDFRKISTITLGDVVHGITANGALYTWGASGSNYSSIFGLEDSTENVYSTPQRIGNETNWKQVYSGQSHVLAINDKGQLMGWGLNNSNQLADSINADLKIPTQIGSDTDWAAAAAGGSFSLAIKDNGHLYAWGANSSGTLGIGSIGPTTIKQPRLITDTLWKQVSAGINHVLAIDVKGKLYSWGTNSNGQLGFGDFFYRLSPTQVGSDSNWVFISAGVYSSFAINDKGELYSWGYNLNGQLGLGDFDVRKTPVRVGTETHWLKVSAGITVNALTKDGKLYSWGNNIFGAAGFPKELIANVNTPKLCKTDSNFVDVVTVFNKYSLYLKSIPNKYTSASMKLTSCDAYISPSGKYTYTESGTYTDTFLNNTSVGCDTIFTIDLTLNKSIITTPTTTACGSWISPTGKIYYQGGTYYDTLSRVTGCDSIIKTQVWVDNVNTQVERTGNVLKSLQGNDNPNDPTRYAWLDCDNGYIEIENETAQTFTPSKNGNYAVYVVTGSCRDTSDCIQVNNLNSEPLNTQWIQVQPNPSSGNFTISTHEAAIGLVKLYQANGQVVMSKDAQNQTTLDLNTTDLAAGIYILQIQHANRVSRMKLIKENF